MNRTPFPTLPPDDEELKRRIHTTATHISANPLLLDQLLSQHANDDKLRFIRPESGKEYEYFEWALNCKRLNQNNEPELMARRALFPSIKIPPPFPLPHSNINENDEAFIKELIDRLFVISDKLQKDSHILLDKNPQQRVIEEINQVNGEIREISKEIMENDRIENKDSVRVCLLCAVLLHLLIDVSYRYGTLPESPESVKNSFPKLLTNYFTTTAENETSEKILGRCLVVLILVNEIELELGGSKPINQSELFKNGTLFWLVRCVVLIGDVLRRKLMIARNGGRIGNVNELEQPIVLVPFDSLALWIKGWEKRFDHPEDYTFFNNWRVAHRPSCSYDNTFQVVGGASTIYSKPRKEMVSKMTSNQNSSPYLAQLPRKLAATIRFGKVYPCNPLKDKDGLAPDDVPVGVMATLLANASQKSKTMLRGFTPYQSLNCPPSMIPPLHTYTPKPYRDTVEQCLKDMASVMDQPARKKRTYDEVERSDDSCEEAHQIADICGTKSPTNGQSSKFSTFQDRAPAPSSTKPFQPAPYSPSHSNSASVSRKGGLGLKSSREGSSSSALGGGGNGNATLSEEHQLSMFDAFRQRRSGSYHQGIINYKMGNSAGLRCYVCQQEGHFAKDCKFGLN